jgi:hypothetical protein
VSSNDGSGPLLLDDGTGIIELSLSGEFRQRQFKAGKLCFFTVQNQRMLLYLINHVQNYG